MERLTPIAAIAAASMLLVGCLEGKGLAKKQDPWATPKGDARVDCAEFKALQDRWSSAHKRAHKEQRKAHAKYVLILENSGFKAAEDWRRSGDNPEIAAKAVRDKLYKQLDIAKINVAKHMGYSEQRLQEMWGWRIGDGPQFQANVGSKKLSQEVIFDMGLPWAEIRSFCKKL